MVGVVPRLKPVQRRATNVQVYEQIRNAVASGQFKPGDTLSTRQFAVALNVSQMPVREAFHRLVAEGVLENRLNRTIGLPLLDLADFDELTAIREQLEGFAAEKAAETLTEKELKGLETTAQQILNSTNRKDRAGYLSANRTFHFSIYNASRSKNLVRMIDQLWLRVGPALNWSSSHGNNVSTSLKHHDAALKALRKRDGAACRAAIVKDISDAADIVRRELK